MEFSQSRTAFKPLPLLRRHGFAVLVSTISVVVAAKSKPRKLCVQEPHFCSASFRASAVDAGTCFAERVLANLGQHRDKINTNLSAGQGLGARRLTSITGDINHRTCFAWGVKSWPGHPPVLVTAGSIPARTC